jgi:hypothetical protein
MTTHGFQIRDDNSIVVLPGLAADDVTGALVYWNLSGPVPVGAFTAAWVAAGFAEDGAPPSPSPETALRRAVQHEKHKRRLARPVPGGWALIDETVQADDSAAPLRHAMSLQAKIAGWVKITPADHPLAPTIEADFAKALDHYVADDFSAWLPRQVERLGGVRLREGGGFYFVPRPSVPAWRALVSVMRSVTGHTLREIPALRAGDVVDAVTEAVSREASEAVAEMEKELVDGDLGARALRGREARCEAARVKVVSYEKLLGQSLDVLREKLDALKVNLAEAALAAEMEAGTR